MHEGHWTSLCMWTFGYAEPWTRSTRRPFGTLFTGYDGDLYDKNYGALGEAVGRDALPFVAQWALCWRYSEESTIRVLELNGFRNLSILYNGTYSITESEFPSIGLHAVLQA